MESPVLRNSLRPLLLQGKLSNIPSHHISPRRAMSSSVSAPLLASKNDAIPSSSSAPAIIGPGSSRFSWPSTLSIKSQTFKSGIQLTGEGKYKDDEDDEDVHDGELLPVGDSASLEDKRTWGTWAIGKIKAFAVDSQQATWPFISKTDEKTSLLDVKEKLDDDWYTKRPRRSPTKALRANAGRGLVTNSETGNPENVKWATYVADSGFSLQRYDSLSAVSDEGVTSTSTSSEKNMAPSRGEEGTVEDDDWNREEGVFLPADIILARRTPNPGLRKHSGPSPVEIARVIEGVNGDLDDTSTANIPSSRIPAPAPRATSGSGLSMRRDHRRQSESVNTASVANQPSNMQRSSAYESGGLTRKYRRRNSVSIGMGHPSQPPGSPRGRSSSANSRFSRSSPAGLGGGVKSPSPLSKTLSEHSAAAIAANEQDYSRVVDEKRNEDAKEEPTQGSGLVESTRQTSLPIISILQSSPLLSSFSLFSLLYSEPESESEPVVACELKIIIKRTTKLTLRRPNYVAFKSLVGLESSKAPDRKGPLFYPGRDTLVEHKFTVRVNNRGCNLLLTPEGTQQHTWERRRDRSMTVHRRLDSCGSRLDGMASNLESPFPADQSKEYEEACGVTLIFRGGSMAEVGEEAINEVLDWVLRVMKEVL